MKLIGFNFNKISIEKMGAIKQAPKIDTSISIPELKEVESEFFKPKETPLEVKFAYEINYSPDIAKLSFEGSLMVLLDKKEAKEALQNWKNKKLDDSFKINLFNIIFRKTSIRAAQMEDELKLPIHFQLPSLSASKEKDSK